jgi:hypothetical protein
VRGVRDHATHDAVYLADVACAGVELAADRRRDSRPGCKHELSRGDPAHGEEVQGGFWTGYPWERAVAFVMGARQ